MSGMHITRFSAGPDGESTFTDVEVALPHRRADGHGHELVSSARWTSPHVQFAVLPEGLDQPWHPAPRRQLVTVLRGTVEVGTPDGHTRRFSPGDTFLADDVATRGHETRTVGGPAEVFFVGLPDDGTWDDL